MTFHVFYTSQNIFENSFGKLSSHSFGCSNKLVNKYYESDFISLNAPKVAFLQQKVGHFEFFELSKLKIGAFKD